MELALDTSCYLYASGLSDFRPHANAVMGLDHFLQKAVDLDLNGVSVSDLRLLDSLEYGYINKLCERAASLKLNLQLSTTGANPDHLADLVRTTHALGSKQVCTRIGPPASAAVADLAQVIPVCERYQVNLILQNQPGLRTEELLSLLQLLESEQVGICFNAGVTLAAFEDPIASCRTLGPALKSVHLKDYQVTATHNGFALLGCALGEGVIDLKGVLDQVSSLAPSVNVVIASHAEKLRIPALEAEYLERFPGVSAAALGRTLRLVRDRGIADFLLTPVERDLSEDQVLAEEEEMVLRSVRWTKQALGRMLSESDN